MKLGLSIGYWGIGPRGQEALDLVRHAEGLGFESVWVAESYGSDVVSVLAWLAGQTETINLGAAIMQVPARPPAAAAMAGATIDWLSGGRFLFGFGPSGPQVAEGWYGLPYHKPYGHTREYVEIVRKIIAREGPLEYDGEHYKLPLPAEQGTGQGKALKLNFHPLRNHIPVFIAAIGEKSVEIAAEIGDGWIPIFFHAGKFEDTFGPSVDAGLKRAGKTRADFEISPSLQVAIDGDQETARNVVKGGLLLYLGGMGSKKQNFYVNLSSRMGFEEEAHRVQELYLDGRRDEAYKAIPEALVDATSLVGSEAQIAERVAVFKDAGVARIICSPAHMDPGQVRHTLERMAALVA